MRHLTRGQREQLQALSRAKQSQRTIAKILGCAQSTVARELRRTALPVRPERNHFSDKSDGGQPAILLPGRQREAFKVKVRMRR
jgi:hypothetical protein